MANKPNIIIKDNAFHVDFSMVEHFTDETMAEKYNNIRALIDMVFPEDCPNEQQAGEV